MRPFEFYFILPDMAARGVSAAQPVKYPATPASPYSHLVSLLDDNDISTGFNLYFEVSRIELAQKAHLCGQPRLVCTVMRLYLSGFNRSKRGIGAARKSYAPRGS